MTILSERAIRDHYRVCFNKNALALDPDEDYNDVPFIETHIMDLDTVRKIVVIITRRRINVKLEKIRSEINQITDTMGVSYNQYVSKLDVLQIIDKYKEGGQS